MTWFFIQLCIQFESDRNIFTKFDLLWPLKVKRRVVDNVNVENSFLGHLKDEKKLGLVEFWRGGGQRDPLHMPD